MSLFGFNLKLAVVVNAMLLRSLPADAVIVSENSQRDPKSSTIISPLPSKTDTDTRTFKPFVISQFLTLLNAIYIAVSVSAIFGITSFFYAAGAGATRLGAGAGDFVGSVEVDVLFTTGVFWNYEAANAYGFEGGLI